MSDDLYRTLSLDEAAAYLHIHPETLRQLALSGRVRAAKPGRAWVFLQCDLVEYLRQRQPQPQAGESWHSSDAAASGTPTSPSVDAAYKKALGLETAPGPRNTTTA